MTKSCPICYKHYESDKVKYKVEYVYKDDINTSFEVCYNCFAYDRLEIISRAIESEKVIFKIIDFLE